MITTEAAQAPKGNDHGSLPHIQMILSKPSPHPVSGDTEASIWRECRDWHVTQGEDRILAGERAWLHINPHGGDCTYLVLAENPLAIPPSKPNAPKQTISLKGRITEPFYVQYCEYHESKACKPVKCEHVCLYHWTPRVRHTLTCQAPFCGETFEASRADAKYHSGACRERARRARYVEPPTFD